MALALDGLAVGNGILTVEDEAQALARQSLDYAG
jgi:6,7-dimethyl-8-ribityllumazine synthase